MVRNRLGAGSRPGARRGSRGCPWPATALHVSHAGPQLAAAPAYLAAHPETSLISRAAGAARGVQPLQPARGGPAGSDQLIAAVNDAIGQLAAAFGAPVADAFSAINHKAGSPAEGLFVCLRTWECGSYQNIHPNNRGYLQMAVALLRAVRH